MRYWSARVVGTLAACAVALLGPTVAEAGAQAPTVTTSKATNVGPDSYVVHGSVNPEGSDTSYSFEWNEFGGSTYYYATSTADAGSGTSAVAVQRRLRAVSDWTYNVNLSASNTSGSATGDNQVVRTPPYASAPGAPGDLDVPRASTGSSGFAAPYQGRAGPTNDGSDGTGFVNNYPDNVGNALVVQHNRAIIVAGTAGATGFDPQADPNGFVLERFTAAGRIDGSFNGGKPVVLAFSGESAVSGNAVGLQHLSGASSDDGIVVAGTGSSGSSQDLLLAQFGPSGAPGGTLFGQGTGQVIVAGGGTAAALVVDPNDNSLWVAGGKGNDATLWHFDVNGNTLGEVMVPGTGPANALVRQSDGELVEAAGSASKLTLIRFSSSGQLDTGFGSGGVASLSASGPALAVAADEHLCSSANCLQRGLIAAGGDSTHFTLARFGEGGTLDGGFGSSGVATTPGTGSPARAVVVQGDGKPIAGGVDVSNPNTGPDMLLVRYTASGALDTSFGIGARVRTGYPDPAGYSTPSGVGADADVAALSLLPDGRVLAAGSDANTPQIIVAPAHGSRAANPPPVPDMALVRYMGGPPGTKITFGPPPITGAQNATFSFTSTVSPATFQCSIDSGSFTSCSSGQSFGPLSYGDHTFAVRSIDAFGHIDPSPPAYTWRTCSGCDALPRTEITSEPAALTNSASASFSFVADDPTDSFECQLDGGAWTACSSPDTIGGLADGSHSFGVRAVNAKGTDPSPPSYQWTVDTVPPHTTIVSGPSGTITSPTATFAFVSNKPGSGFECKLDGAAWSSCFSPATYLVSNGDHVFTVRAIDPAGNVDPSPPSRKFTFQQSQCSVTAKFAYVVATGCLGKKAGRYISTPGGDVRLNGLTLHPTGASTTITVDPVGHKITSSGQVLVSASEVQVDQEQLNWSVPRKPAHGSESVGAINPPAGAAVAGMSFQGDLALALNGHQGADLTGNIQLPFGTIASALGINGTVELHTTQADGLKHDKLTITRDYFEIAGVGVKQLKVVYSPTDDLWEGAASIAIPTPNELDVAADLSFQHGSFHKFSGSVDGLNYPIVDGVFLQRIAVVFGVDPTTIGGGLGLSFGPQEDGGTLVRVDGNFLYQGQYGSNPGHIHVDGTVTLAGFKLTSGYFDYFTSGLVKFGATANLGLPDTSDTNPQNEPVSIDATLAGIVQAPHFDVDVKAQVGLNFIDTSVNAEVLVSDIGLVACAHLSAFGFGWDPGAGYKWSTGHLDLMWDSCSVGPYKTLQYASDAAAGGRILRLPGGSALVGLTGATAAPRVTLAGPHGQRVSVPTSSVKPLMVPGFMVFQDPRDKVTYVAIQHSAGSWRIVPEAGSSAIVAVRSAAILPPPSVTARVTGGGRRRTLHWHERQIPGQRVIFWERGRDSAQIIGSSSRPDGTREFTIANGSAGRRVIVAQVLSYGKPRANLVVARYAAPSPLTPGRPRHLKAVPARGGGVRISWARSALAHRYVVMIVTADGAHLLEFAPGRAGGITLRNVVPIRAARIEVTAELAPGVRGQTARIRYRAAQPKHHRHKHHHRG
jgi:uncharacterized delta-60 repeat protein